MKNNYKLKLLCILYALTAIVSGCKKSTVVEEQSLSNNHNSTAIAGDGKWDLLGYGYDMTGEYLALRSTSSAPVIDMKRFETDYLSRINSPTTGGGEHNSFYGASAYEFVQDINKKKEYNASVSLGDKTPADKGQYNFTGSWKRNTSDQNVYTFTSKYSYAQFQNVISIKRLQFTADVTRDLLMNYLTPEFLNNVNTYSAEDLIRIYGTHVLLDISLGGRMNFNFNASIVNQTNVATKTKKTENALGFFVSKFGINLGLTSSTDEMTKSFNESRERTMFLTFHGGSNSGRTVSFDSNGYSAETISIADWERSVTVNNCALTAIDRAAPIYEFIADPAKKEQVRIAVEKYIKDRQITLLPTELYEFYYSAKGRHAYNLNQEMNVIFPKYQPNGQPFKVYALPFNDAVPIYQYYNTSNEDHVLSASSNPGWAGYNQDGIICYAHATQVPGSVPIYEFYHNSGNHYYSTDINAVAAYPGWRMNGIPFYAFKN